MVGSVPTPYRDGAAPSVEVTVCSREGDIRIKQLLLMDVKSVPVQKVVLPVYLHGAYLLHVYILSPMAAVVCVQTVGTTDRHTRTQQHSLTQKTHVMNVNVR